MKKLLLLFSMALICILNSSLLNAMKPWYEEDILTDKPYYQEPKGYQPKDIEEEFEIIKKEPVGGQQVIDPSKAGMFEEKEFFFKDPGSEDPSKGGFFEEGDFDFDDDDDWYIVD